MTPRKYSKFNPHIHSIPPDMSLRYFIDSIKVDFGHWLCNNVYQYPFCCHISSHMLYEYLRYYYPDIHIFAGTYPHQVTGRWGDHAWLDTKEGYIDFVLFQFYSTRENYSEYSELPAKQLYDNIVKRIQKDVIISKRSKLALHVVAEPFPLNMYNPQFYVCRHPEPFFVYIERVGSLLAQEMFSRKS